MPPAGMRVAAVNRDSGFTYETRTLPDGSYAITGLPPGVYELHISEPSGTAKSEPLTLAVGDSAAVDLSMTRDEEKDQEIVITGSRQRMAVKTSEVGTNVPPNVIEALPQATHNFLSSVDLAPGVAFEQDQGTGFTSLHAGARSRDDVNVFIDGVSQKNNILRGGLIGQDTSRGNPFPQSAVKEFKVITQNYRAEFDQVSSAAISAATKSGTNELHGDAYLDRTETQWRAKSPLEIQKEHQGQLLLPSSKNEFGFSLGGPIKKDAVHFFLAYDGKNINDSRQVVPKYLDKYRKDAGIVPTLASRGGSYVDPFDEHLLFGKVDAQLASERRLTAEVTLRLESDRVPENREVSADGNRKDRSNNELRVDALHEWNLGSRWVSQTRAGYQWAVWNPHSAASAPEIQYKISSVNDQLLSSSSDILWDGGSPDAQRRAQSGLTLSQEMTYTGLPNHLFKSGAKVSFLNYDLSGTPRSVDVVQTVVDLADGDPYFDGTHCTGKNVINDGNNSDQCRIDRALAPTSVSMNNAQIGLYAQDDWDLTRRLQLNLGVRWDVETNMLNNGYATPADRVAALEGLDTRTFQGQTPEPGQTYAQSLAKGGIDIADYISDGHSRRAYLGAIAPRLGFSYDVLADKRTVVFGGYGRSYDRTMANHAIDEKQKNLVPGSENGEIWLIRNDLKMPYTDQFSLGIRQAVFTWNLEAVVSDVEGRNQFQWFSGNRDLLGGFGSQSFLDPLWGGPKGYGSLILGDFVGQTRARSLMLKAEKPYTKASGWTATIAYTFTDAQTKNREWTDDLFDWTYGRSAGWNPWRLIDPHRLVVAAMADTLLPWGMMLSGKFTYGSGLPRKIWGCPSGDTNACDGAHRGPVLFKSTGPEFRQLDLCVAKRFRAGPGAFTVRADILNVFNWTNYSVRSNNSAGQGVPAGQQANSFGLSDPAVDEPEGLRGPTRTVRIAASYSF